MEKDLQPNRILFTLQEPKPPPMKPFNLLVFLLLASFGTLHAQSTTERGIQYQAVVRDNDGNMLPNAGVNFRFTLKHTNWYGGLITDYAETHVATTNTVGLVNLVIGNGTPESPYSSFDFGNTPWFEPSLTLNVEVDPTGSGTSYSLLSSAPLRAVPFAYFARQAQESQYAYYAAFAEETYESYMAYSLYSPYTDAITFNNPSNSFSGNGSGLTNLSAGSINSGVLGGQFGGTGVDASGISAGSLLISNLGSWQILPPGLNGQVLKMVGGTPTWSDEPRGRLIFSQNSTGIPTNPVGATDFITPVCTLNVTAAQQNLVVISTVEYQINNSSPPYTVDGGISLSLVARNALYGFEFILDTTFGIYKNGDRKQYCLHGNFNGIPIGTYYIGIKGYRDPSYAGTVTGTGFKQQTLLFD